MDSIKNKKSDFFPSMLLREVNIVSARISTLLACLYLTTYYIDDLH